MLNASTSISLQAIIMSVHTHAMMYIFCKNCIIYMPLSTTKLHLL